MNLKTFPLINEPDVTASSWLNHFESLHTKHTIGPEQINILQTLKTLEKEPTNNLLDERISEYEIINAARKLKNNKSAYSDKIRNETDQLFDASYAPVQKNLQVRHIS